MKTENIKLIRCFVASPSDTKEEREICDQVIDDINRTIGTHHSFRLETLRWEKDVYPAFSSSPQQAINDQIAGNFEIFIGIMWKRFGAPTEKYGSGTEEEFEIAYQKYLSKDGTHIMLYFNDTSPRLADINADELRKIQKFQERVGKLGGLYHRYCGQSEFRLALHEHLTKFLLRERDIVSTQEDLFAKNKPVVSAILKANLENALCSGLINPDTNLGGNLATIDEVFNGKTTSFFFNGVQE